MLEIVIDTSTYFDKYFPIVPLYIFIFQSFFTSNTHSFVFEAIFILKIELSIILSILHNKCIDIAYDSI